MHLDKAIFTIDASAYVDRLCDFISERMATLHREGILVAFSGGVDSSTVLLLCARAVGREHVTAVLLPELQGNPEALRYARLVTRQFGIQTIVHNISSILGSLGTYNFILSILPSRRLQDWATRKYLRTASENPYLQLTQGHANAFQRKGFARMNSKRRVRLVMMYLLAEERHFMVVGCAHKSEDLLGLYVKFGVDDNADLMPLKNLYRSQILQLATYLGVPEEIIQRTPNPDIIPGVSDKYIDILGLPSETLDLLVYGIEHGMEAEEIASQLQLPLEKVRQIHELVLQTEHMRRPSQSLVWE